jgi:hypothetical protein
MVNWTWEPDDDEGYDGHEDDDEQHSLQDTRTAITRRYDEPITIGTCAQE